MAQEATQPVKHDVPAMDYREHEATYFNFLKLALASILATAIILVVLIMMTYAGGIWPKIFGTLGLIFGALAFVVTLISDRLNWVPGLVVLGFTTVITLVLIL